MALLRVVLDTNQWIYLAENPQGQSVIAELRRLHASGKIDLVLLDTVAGEFAKHKNEVTDRYYKIQSSYISTAKNLARIKGAPGDELKKILTRYQDLLNKAKATMPATVADIESLFGTLKQERLADKQRLNALSRLQEATPPAHRYTQSSVGDALIWEGTLGLLDRTDVAFCTNNTKDFSNPEHGLQLHPDLQAEAQRKAYKLIYHTSVDALLEFIGAEIATRENLKRAEAEAAALERALRKIRESLPYGKDALEYDTVNCDQCGHDTVIAPMPGGGAIQCAFCKVKYPDAEQCGRCGAWVLSGLQDIDICDECLDNVMDD